MERFPTKTTLLGTGAFLGYIAFRKARGLFFDFGNAGAHRYIDTKTGNNRQTDRAPQDTLDDLPQPIYIPDTLGIASRRTNPALLDDLIDDTTDGVEFDDILVAAKQSLRSSDAGQQG